MESRKHRLKRLAKKAKINKFLIKNYKSEILSDKYKDGHIHVGDKSHPVDVRDIGSNAEEMARSKKEIKMNKLRKIKGRKN